MSKKISQLDLIKEFFEANPHRDIPHAEAVDWLTLEWKSRTGEVFRDPDRGIRSLSQKGQLIKVAKGIYHYDPDLVENRHLEDFSQVQKNEILKRDGYKCVICGKGPEHGIELQVDHIKSKDFGGKAFIENGQTLCAQHNFQKKNYKQTETGKKMFIRLYELAKKLGDTKHEKFCADVLNMFEKHDVNGHIEWEK